MVGGFEELLHVACWPVERVKGCRDVQLLMARGGGLTLHLERHTGWLPKVLGQVEKIMMVCKMTCLTVVPVTNIQRCLRGLHDLWCEISRVTEEPGVRQKMDGCLAF